MPSVKINLTVNAKTFSIHKNFFFFTFTFVFVILFFGNVFFCSLFVIIGKMEIEKLVKEKLQTVPSAKAIKAFFEKDVYGYVDFLKNPNEKQEDAEQDFNKAIQEWKRLDKLLITNKPFLFYTPDKKTESENRWERQCNEWWKEYCSEQKVWNLLYEKYQTMSDAEKHEFWTATVSPACLLQAHHMLETRDSACTRYSKEQIDIWEKETKQEDENKSKAKEKKEMKKEEKKEKKEEDEKQKTKTEEKEEKRKQLKEQIVANMWPKQDNNKTYQVRETQHDLSEERKKEIEKINEYFSKRKINQNQAAKLNNAELFHACMTLDPFRTEEYQEALNQELQKRLTHVIQVDVEKHFDEYTRTPSRDDILRLLQKFYLRPDFSARVDSSKLIVQIASEEAELALKSTLPDSRGVFSVPMKCRCRQNECCGKDEKEKIEQTVWNFCEQETERNQHEVCNKVWKDIILKYSDEDFQDFFEYIGAFNRASIHIETKYVSMSSQDIKQRICCLLKI